MLTLNNNQRDRLSAWCFYWLQYNVFPVCWSNFIFSLLVTDFVLIWGEARVISIHGIIIIIIKTCMVITVSISRVRIFFNNSFSQSLTEAGHHWLCAGQPEPPGQKLNNCMIAAQSCRQSLHSCTSGEPGYWGKPLFGRHQVALLFQAHEVIGWTHRKKTFLLADKRFWKVNILLFSLIFEVITAIGAGKWWEKWLIFTSF